MNEEEKTVSEELDVANEAYIIAHEIRREIVCCDIYGRVNDGVTNEQADVNHHMMIDEINRHSLCYWGEGSARLAEEIGLSRKRAMVHSHDQRVALIADVLTRGVGVHGIAATALAEHIISELTNHDDRLMAAHELTNMDLYPDREGIPNRDMVKRERVPEGHRRVTRAQSIRVPRELISVEAQEVIESLEGMRNGLVTPALTLEEGLIKAEAEGDDERCELCRGDSSSPSYRCYIHRHLDCEPDGPEAGCGCHCHRSKTAEEGS